MTLWRSPNLTESSKCLFYPVCWTSYGQICLSLFVTVLPLKVCSVSFFCCFLGGVRRGGGLQTQFHLAWFKQTSPAGVPSCIRYSYLPAFLSWHLPRPRITPTSAVSLAASTLTRSPPPHPLQVSLLFRECVGSGQRESPSALWAPCLRGQGRPTPPAVLTSSVQIYHLHQAMLCVCLSFRPSSLSFK